MQGYFKFKKATNLHTELEGVQLPESDFSVMRPDGTFVQYDYVSPDSTARTLYPVKPGIYSIDVENQAIVLKDTQFTQQPILEEYVATKDITHKIDTFFSKIDVYKKFGLDPKRAILLYGKPGCGKSQTISKVCTEYGSKQDTVVVVWPSDKFEPRHVKDFIKTFDYDAHSISKLILVIEDLGGTEQQDGPRFRSDSSLLSLLDNVEQTFKIPTMILATTNYPEKFLENLTDRPQRFDDVMEVKTPNGEFRAKFLEFFSQGAASDLIKEEISNKKYDGLSVAHIKEVVIRSAVYDINMQEALEQIYVQSAKSKKGFTNSKQLGLGDY
jgi:AAA+ superfamily predicted ATPase